jgi:hypothetical protein
MGFNLSEHDAFEKGAPLKFSGHTFTLAENECTYLRSTATKLWNLKGQRDTEQTWTIQHKNEIHFFRIYCSGYRL